MIPAGLAPPPVEVGGRSVVAAELSGLEARVTFLVGQRRATAEAVMRFSAGPADGQGGWAAFDLRQTPAAARLDGAPIDAAGMGRLDLGGGPGAAMRVLDRPLGPGPHVLEIEYELTTPDVERPLPVRWPDGGVAWDVWCSDLHPGRYLEQWLPVGLCQDRFGLTLDIDVVGATRAHTLIANGGIDQTGPSSWRVRFADHHTSLSSLAVLAPADELRHATAEAGDIAVELCADTSVEAEPAALCDAAVAWLEADRAAMGPYLHGPRFVACIGEVQRGMEYDGAMTGSASSLEHEVFHAWWGRGVKPACAGDGWIDEAVTTWWTSDHPELPRRAALPLGLDEPPAVLAPSSPWCRATPIAAYRTGSRLMAGLAHAAGGAAALEAALARCFTARAGGFVHTDDLRDDLSEALSFDVGPWWDRYVRGMP